MNIPQLILSIVDVAAAIFLIAVVLLQSGKSAGLSGAIAGVADTFMAKNRAKTWDAKLAKLTKWVAIGFVRMDIHRFPLLIQNDLTFRKIKIDGPSFAALLP